MQIWITSIQRVECEILKHFLKRPAYLYIVCYKILILLVLLTTFSGPQENENIFTETNNRVGILLCCKSNFLSSEIKTPKSFRYMKDVSKHFITKTSYEIFLQPPPPGMCGFSQKNFISIFLVFIQNIFFFLLLHFILYTETKLSYSAILLVCRDTECIIEKNVISNELKWKKLSL